jgi:AraC-like DNA-binding protein
MKASFEQIIIGQEESFLCYWTEQPIFQFDWHYHPEFELTYIEVGQGTRFVGDDIGAFEPGDLVLLGSNLPHTWACDPESESIKRGDTQRAIVLQFPENLFNSTDSIPEVESIRSLLQQASQGLAFKGNIDHIVRLLKELTNQRGLKKYLNMLQLLGMMAEHEGVKVLASSNYTPSLKKSQEDRIGKILEYINDNYDKDINLGAAAEYAQFSETAFCRFFRKNTGLTFTNYVNELRIGKACRLLHEYDWDIARISKESGFGSLTHFNRTFMKVKGMNPRKYRKGYSGGHISL